VELQIAAQLELAISMISRRREEEALNLISEAQEKCVHLTGDNSTFLQGRSEYILSRLYRYKKDYNKAEEHTGNAVKILFPVEPGEDSGFAKYCYACVLLDSSGSQSKVKEIENYLRSAICDNTLNHNSGLSIMTPHAHMKLAQMHLGSSHYAAGNITDKEKVRAAENCLKAIDQDKLLVLSKCHFRLMESDLYQSKGMSQKSKAAAQKALDLAEQYNFTNEIESANNRLSAGHTPS